MPWAKVAVLDQPATPAIVELVIGANSLQAASFGTLQVPMIYNWPIRKVNWVSGSKWGTGTKPDSASLVEQLSPAGC